jgi:hypothetical protein
MRYLLFLFILFPTALTLAQEPNLMYGEQALTIDLEPAFPSPEETYTASLNDYSLPVQGAGVRWFIDGKLLEETKNQRTIDLTAPVAGKRTEIEMVLDLPSGGTVSAKRVVEPVYLDIIVEPQTRVPAFYRGRSLPSIGSQINATALVNGNQIKPEELLYTWRINNETIEGGTLRSQNSVSFTMPRGKFATLSLEVRRVQGGETLAKRLLDITNNTPLLHFYEKNILLGFSTKAVGDSLSLIGNELTVRAEPYYLDLNVFNRPDHLEWEIDNTPTANPGGNPYEVTLSRTSLGGSSIIGFHVRDLDQVLQGAQSSFRITGSQ